MISVYRQPISRSIFPKIAFFYWFFSSGSFFILLTRAEIKAFNWLKALISASVSKNKKKSTSRKELVKITAVSGYVNMLYKD